MNTDEKFAEMALAIQQLSQTVARLAINQQEGNIHAQDHGRHTEDRTMRIDVSKFAGTTHNPEEYLD